MEKPGIEPATPGLQGIALIHYTTGASPIELKFQMETPKDKETKVCSNGPGHMAKVTVVPIYGI